MLLNKCELKITVYTKDDVSKLWVWLECIGVVSGCCCKEVYRYPHNNYYFSLLHLYYIALFLAAASRLLCSFLKCFLDLVYY